MQDTYSIFKVIVFLYVGVNTLSIQHKTNLKYMKRWIDFFLKLCNNVSKYLPTPLIKNNVLNL